MSRIQWEYDRVERPFREQLRAMGWQWIEGHKEVPDFTERANFREVLRGPVHRPRPSAGDGGGFLVNYLGWQLDRYLTDA